MSLSLHNTLLGKKEPFKPLEKGKVGLYVCGITPYDEVHLGHARCYVVFDVLKRVLRKNNYKVNHIQNFTDIDDKIIERANQKKADPLNYANQFIDQYHQWMKKLNVEPADEYPRVTTSMEIIVDLIDRLVKKGIAYEMDGDVLFAVRQFPAYGQLSKRKIDELEAGARVQVDEKKKDPLDFALWKKSKPGEPAWDSPWGQGRPGWHIECSAMSMKYLGEKFDIHGGGQDLIFPHHENEVAQSNGALDKKDGFAQVWVHNGFVTINKQKMSKSLGNFFTVKDILAKFDPMSVRYFLLSQHYKSPLNFSDQDLSTAKTTWQDRIVGAYEVSSEWKASTNGADNEIEALKKTFFDSLNDDLNTPAALGSLNQLCSLIFQAGKNKKELPGGHAVFSDMLDTLGLKVEAEQSWDEDILKLVQDREQARKDRDWKKSDVIRDQLKEKGVLVVDTAQGSRLKRL